MSAKGCVLRCTQDQSLYLPAGWHPIIWNQEDYDNGGYHATDSTDIVIPNGEGGLYFIYGCASTGSNDPPYVGLTINNYMARKFLGYRYANEGGGLALIPRLSWEGYLNAGDTIKFGYIISGQGTTIMSSNWSSVSKTITVLKVDDTTACSITQTNLTSITPDTPTTFSWNSETYDTGGFWSSGSVLTIPSTGLYHMLAYFDWEVYANERDDDRVIAILKNGVQIYEDRHSTYAHEWMENYIVWEGMLTGGDQIQVSVYHNAAAARNILTGYWSPRICIRKILSV